MRGVMTVRGLRKALKKLPGDTLIVLARDEEGNAFSPLADISRGKYSRSRREYVDNSDDWAAPGDAVPVVTLWPMD